MVEKTLDAMRNGGIYDQIGFGFHRYATDAEWRVPHFEKTLYDQALLAMAYTEACQATGEPRFGDTARKIVAYLLREMMSPQGGCYTAEDADSEGVEGNFYLWTEAQLRDALGDRAEAACRAFGVEPEGNFIDEATGRRSGSNILRHAGAAAGSEDARRKLFEARERRVHPNKDDKILADWNGLAIAALAKAARAFDRPEYARAAGRCADFLLSRMRTPDGRLLHRFRDGEAAIAGNLDDYAFLVWGLIELYQSNFDPRLLQAAIELNGAMSSRFRDKELGGFFFTPDDGEPLPMRQKTAYDGAVPSGNAVAMGNLLRLAALTGNTELDEEAGAIERAFAGPVGEQASGHCMLLGALDFEMGPSSEVVVAGVSGRKDTREMLRALGHAFLPNTVVVFRPSEQATPAIERLAPFTEGLAPLNGAATAYVCRDHVCTLPATDVSQVMESLNRP